MKKSELKKLKSDCERMHKNWLKRGKRLTTYHCNHCNDDIITTRPQKSDTGSKGYWDSATICYECGGMNFVAVWPDGKTKSVKMNV